MLRLGKEEKTAARELECGLLFVASVLALIEITGLTRSPFYPLIYFSAAIFGLILRPGVALASFLFLITGEAVPILVIFGRGGIDRGFIERCLTAGFFFFAFLSYRSIEERKKKELVAKLAQFEEDVENIKMDSSDSETGITDRVIQKVAERTLATIDDSLFSILTEVKKAFRFESVVYLVPERGGSAFRIREASSEHENFTFHQLIESGPIKDLIRTREPILINRGDDSKGVYPEYYLRSETRVSSFVAVPVVQGTEVIGVLVGDRKTGGPITPADLEALKVISIALEDIQTARIELSRMALSLRQLEDLFGISRSLAKAINVREVFDNVLDSVHKILPARMMAFSLARGDENVLIRVWGEGARALIKKRFKNGDSPVGWVMENRKYLVFPEKEWKRDLFGKNIKVTREGALLLFPIYTEESLIGTFIINTVLPDAPSPFHTRLLETIISMMAVSLKSVRLMAQIRKMAITDPMTGLFNRRQFNRILREHVEHGERYKDEFGLLLIDIDRFKKINDTFGHPAGDEVIKNIANLIKKESRGVDIPSRIGGEEFTVLVPKSSKKNALVLAERIRKRAKKLSFFFDGKETEVTVSIGIAIYPKNGMNGVELLKSADQSLYDAKNAGRDRCVVK